MKEYEVSFIFKIYVEAENLDAQNSLIDLNWSDCDEITVEEVES